MLHESIICFQLTIHAGLSLEHRKDLEGAFWRAALNDLLKIDIEGSKHTLLELEADFQNLHR